MLWALDLSSRRTKLQIMTFCVGSDDEEARDVAIVGERGGDFPFFFIITPHSLERR